MSYANSAVLGIRESVVADITRAQDSTSFISVLKNALRVAECVVASVPQPQTVPTRVSKAQPPGETAAKLVAWVTERPMTRSEIVDRMVEQGICKNKETAYVNLRHHMKKLFPGSIEEVEGSNPIQFRSK